MRDYDGNPGAYIAARAGTVARHLVWIVARNRSTNAPEAMGLWTGDEVRLFNVDGEVRTYYGAGALVQLEPIRAGVGLAVRIHQFSLSPLTPEVAQLIRGYDTRLGSVEVHRALYSLETEALVAPPVRLIRGWVNSLSLTTGAVGGAGEATISVASAARALTRTLSLFRSDAAQRRVSATDRFREYADISGEVGVWWGEKQGGARARNVVIPPPTRRQDRDWNGR
jgi:hypothetical protein